VSLTPPYTANIGKGGKSGEKFIRELTFWSAVQNAHEINIFFPQTEHITDP
jgi:hypothetical protein